jgi:hypothetical protein
MLLLFFQVSYKENIYEHYDSAEEEGKLIAKSTRQ